MPILPTRSELLPGTLAMLVLKTLTVDAMHGYAIAQHTRQGGGEREGRCEAPVSHGSGSA